MSHCECLYAVNYWIWDTTENPATVTSRSQSRPDEQMLWSNWVPPRAGRTKSPAMHSTAFQETIVKLKLFRATRPNVQVGKCFNDIRGRESQKLARTSCCSRSLGGHLSKDSLSTGFTDRCFFILYMTRHQLTDVRQWRHREKVIIELEDMKYGNWDRLLILRPYAD